MDPAPDAFLVQNNSDQPLRLVRGTAEETIVEPGGESGYNLDQCSSTPIEATWPDGSDVALLDEEYCHDQVWVVSGIDNAELVDDE
jgi:hypothetical protein